MFKRKDPVDLAKWSFNLGVQQERMRIKKLISEFSTQVSSKRNELDMYHAELDKPTLKELEKDLETHYRAMEILNKLVTGQWQPSEEYGPAPIDSPEATT